MYITYVCLSRYIFSVLFWATQRDTFLSIGPGVRRSPGPNSDPPLPMRWRSLAMAVKIRIPQMEDKIGRIVERRNPANQLRLVVFLIIFRVSKTSQGFTKLVIHSIRTFFFVGGFMKKIEDILALPYPYLSLIHNILQCLSNIAGSQWRFS